MNVECQNCGSSDGLRTELDLKWNPETGRWEAQPWIGDVECFECDTVQQPTGDMPEPDAGQWVARHPQNASGMAADDVAHKVAQTLAWAAKQSAFPLFVDIEDTGDGAAEFTINEPSGARFRLLLERIG